MPTLKDELRRMAQVIGSRSGMPSGSTVYLANGTTSYVAPADGLMKVTTGFNTSVYQTVRLSASGGSDATHWLPMSASVAICIPVAKGQTVTISAPDPNSGIWFIKTLGALWGGA